MDFGTADAISIVETEEICIGADEPCQACEAVRKLALAVPRKGRGRPRVLRCSECELDKKREDRRKAAPKWKKYKHKLREYMNDNGGDEVAALNRMRLENGNEPKGRKPCSACKKEFVFYHTRQVRCDRCQFDYEKNPQK